MNHSKELIDFISAPDTVDFVVRGTDALFEYMSKNSDIVLSQTLSGRYVIAHIKADKFTEFASAVGSGFISFAPKALGLLDNTALDLAGIIPVQEQPYLALRGSGVLFGFVDTGIDYTQPCFIYEDGTTKIKYIYDQTANGEPPEGFFIGHEYSEQEINEALRSESPETIVPQKDEIGHGTFLASVAGGREVKADDYIGAAPDAEIIAVKLAQAKPFFYQSQCIPASQKAAYESTSVMIGVDYIVKKAKQLDRPVVICLGIGTNLGSHDGFSVFEEYLDGISNLRGVCLVAAAGNESQERHHMSGKISATGETADIDVKVVANAGCVAFSIWNDVADRISVSLRSPTGELVSRIPARPGVISTTKLVLEPAQVNVQYYFPVEGSSGQLTYIRILNATPGIWTITLHGDIILIGDFDAWLPITGFVAEGVEFSASSPYKTVVVPTTALGAITTGAYDSLSKSLYLKSSWGPTRSGMVLPDLVAPGVNIRGYFPTGFSVMSGTSVAAAITAGACALLLQWGIVEKNDPSMSTFQIRAYLIRGCDRSPGIKYPNNQWGYGTLDLIRTFQLMRDL